MDVDLLEHWVTAAKEPDDQPVQWFRHGAPSGLLHPILDRGVFELYDQDNDGYVNDKELMALMVNPKNDA